MQSFSKILPVLLLSTAILATSGCKKESATSDSNQGAYYVKFTANGKNIEYRGGMQQAGDFPDAPINNQYAGTIYGKKDANSQEKNILSILIQDTGKIILNQSYCNYVPADGTFHKATLFYISYFDDSGNIYQSVPEEFRYNTGVLSDAQLKLTEKTTHGIKGSFSGTLYDTDEKTSVKISNGSFYVFQP